jgi:hypothetical protein
MRRPRSTVVELTRVAVEAPLVDGARSWTRRLGIFSAFEPAADWVQRAVVENADDDYGLLYYEATEIVVDYGERRCRSLIYGRDGAVRGEVSGAVERPWGGRPPESCRFRRGDVVGFVGHVYRVGVVLGLPPSPAEAHRLSGITIGDDRFLVGLLSDDGSPETNDHEHPHEAHLFPVEHELPDGMRAALARRFDGYAR